jgi:hypothetical protein
VTVNLDRAVADLVGRASVVDGGAQRGRARHTAGHGQRLVAEQVADDEGLEPSPPAWVPTV